MRFSRRQRVLQAQVNDEYLGSGLPEEGVLFSVHPGLQLQRGILPKRRHDEAEEQSDQHEHSWQDNLKHKSTLS